MSLPLFPSPAVPEGSMFVLGESIAVHPVTLIALQHLGDPHAELDAARDYRLGVALRRLDALGRTRSPLDALSRATD